MTRTSFHTKCLTFTLEIQIKNIIQQIVGSLKLRYLASNVSFDGSRSFDLSQWNQIILIILNASCHLSH